MTIDEAIKALEGVYSAAPGYHANSLYQARRLGIEALKWVKRYRPDNKTDKWAPLPGETKD